MRAGARKPRECSETRPSSAVEIVEPLGHRHVARVLGVGRVGLVRIGDRLPSRVDRLRSRRRPRRPARAPARRARVLRRPSRARRPHRRRRSRSDDGRPPPRRRPRRSRRPAAPSAARPASCGGSCRHGCHGASCASRRPARRRRRQRPRLRRHRVGLGRRRSVSGSASSSGSTASAGASPTASWTTSGATGWASGSPGTWMRVVTAPARCLGLLGHAPFAAAPARRRPRRRRARQRRRRLAVRVRGHELLVAVVDGALGRGSGAGRLAAAAAAARSAARALLRRRRSVGPALAGASSLRLVVVLPRRVCDPRRRRRPREARRPSRSTVVRLVDDGLVIRPSTRPRSPASSGLRLAGARVGFSASLSNVIGPSPASPAATIVANACPSSTRPIVTVAFLPTSFAASATSTSTPSILPAAAVAS